MVAVARAALPPRSPLSCQRVRSTARNCRRRSANGSAAPKATLAQGAQTGVKLAVAVGAMVLAFVALVALANGLLAGIGGWFGYPELSFQGLLGWLFSPVMFLLGIPWGEAQVAGVDLEPLPIAAGELPAGLLPTTEGWLRTEPSMLADAGGLDGFFVARWRHPD